MKINGVEMDVVPLFVLGPQVFVSGLSRYRLTIQDLM
jgi:hypothetical protein